MKAILLSKISALKFNWNQYLDSEDALFAFRGKVTPKVVIKLIPLIEVKLFELGAENFTKKRLVNVSIELLQNLMFHSYPDKGKKYRIPHEFAIVFENNHFVVVSSNLVDNKKAILLKDRLLKLNSIDNEAVKFLYNAVMKQSYSRAPKGGAGLGLLDMRRKTGYPFEYHFELEDKKVSRVFLKVKIPNKSTPD